MAAALTRAKKLDTSRKNSLTRLLDSIPQLLEDQGVSPERLVEARKSCKAAWEQFALAHDALIEVRTEEEDPDEQEYGTWVRKVGSRGSTATCKLVMSYLQF